jgi:hypothetical protein
VEPVRPGHVQPGKDDAEHRACGIGQRRGKLDDVARPTAVLADSATFGGRQDTTRAGTEIGTCEGSGSCDVDP